MPPSAQTPWPRLVADKARLIVQFDGVLFERDQGCGWQRRPFYILCVLMERAGKVVSATDLYDVMLDRQWTRNEDGALPSNRHLKAALLEAINQCTAPEASRAKLAALVKNVRARGILLDIPRESVGFGDCSAAVANSAGAAPLVRPDVLSVRLVHKTLHALGGKETVRFRVACRDVPGVEVEMPALGCVVDADGNGLVCRPIGEYADREIRDEPPWLAAQRVEFKVEPSAYLLRDGIELEVYGVPIGQEQQVADDLFRELRRGVRLKVAGKFMFGPDDDPLDWDW